MGKSWGNHGKIFVKGGFHGKIMENHGKIFVNGSFHGTIHGKSTNIHELEVETYPKATQFQNLDFPKISVFPAPVKGNIGDSTMRTVTSQKVQWSASEVNPFLMVP